jgi:phosphoheptose isomerase
LAACVAKFDPLLSGWAAHAAGAASSRMNFAGDMSSAFTVAAVVIPAIALFSQSSCITSVNRENLK